MSPKRSLSTREITALLAQLSTTSQAYPPELLAARRSRFMKQAADMKIGPQSLSGNVASTLHSGVVSTMEIVLRSVLGIMLAGLVVTAAVVYREEIVDFFAPGDGGAVSSEAALLPPTYTPVPLSSPLTPTNLTPPPSRMAPSVGRTPPTTFSPMLKELTPTATHLPKLKELTPTEDGHHGKKLGHTPTPQGQRDTPRP